MIDQTLRTPLYLQLKNHLEQEIQDGNLLPGDKLPSEYELCQLYKVSRTTVRQAIRTLIQKGLVYSEHGKGTFVNIPTISQDFSQIVRFSATLKPGGLSGYTKIYSFFSEANNPKAESALGCPFCNLNLIGYAKDTPVVYYRSFIRNELKELVYKTAAELELKRAAFSSYDLYDSLGVKLSRAEQTIGAMLSNKEQNSIFHFTKDNALIVLESVYYSSDNVPLEYKIGYYRSDIYNFHIQRKF